MSDELKLLICITALAVMGWCVFSLSTKGQGVAISPRLAMIGYVVACLVGAVNCGVLVTCQHVFRPEYAPRTWLGAVYSAAFSAGLTGMMWLSIVIWMWTIRSVTTALRQSRQPTKKAETDPAPRDPATAGESYRDEETE